MTQPEGMFDRDQRIGWASSPDEATLQAVALVWDSCASLLEHVTSHHAVTEQPGDRLRWSELDDQDQAAIASSITPVLKAITAAVPLVDQTAGDHR